MYRRTTVSLAGPLCACPTQRLRRNPSAERDGSYGLTVHCETCGVKLTVPAKIFQIDIVLDTPYPEDVPELREARREVDQLVGRR